MDKIPIYFVPGMAASPLIFDYIKLPADRFEVRVLEWIMPIEKESLKDYSKRLALGIKHDNPVVIGVSMGGLVVQEIAKVIQVRKVIIISSVKCNAEFPRRMRVAKIMKLYRFFPTRMMQNVDRINRYFPPGNRIKKRLELYEKFLAVRDKKYLDWAFEKIIEWDRAKPEVDVIHIHGTDDMVFPAKYLKDYIPVKGGTHIMILNRYNWFNENLPGIILGETDIEKLKVNR